MDQKKKKKKKKGKEKIAKNDPRKVRTKWGARCRGLVLHLLKKFTDKNTCPIFHVLNLCE